MRPTNDVLDVFYGLSDLNNEKRNLSVASILDKANSNDQIEEYCIDRLISGIGSARAATRIGYSTALTLILDKCHDKWPIEKLFQLADKKLDLNDKERGAANAIGQYLLCTTIIGSSAYEEDYAAISEKLCHLYRQFTFLGITICYTIADMGSKMETKKFKKAVYPRIKDYVESALSTPLPEFLILVLSIAKKHGSVLSDSLSFVKKDGTIEFDLADYTNLLLALKKCDVSSVKFFTEQLLQCGKEGNQFFDIYCRVIEKWAASGDESKVLERIFKTAEMSLEYTTTHNDIMAVFSPVMVSKISSVILGKQGPQQRLLKTKISSFCTIFAEKLINALNDNAAILEVLHTFDKIGNFEVLSMGLVTGPLISKMDKDAVSKWIETVTTEAGIRKITSVFSQWSHEAQLAALNNLVGRPASDDIYYTISNCIDSLFKIKVKPGESVTVTFTNESEGILRTLVESFAGNEVKKTLKTLKKHPLCKPLSILWLCLKLWGKLTVESDQQEFYKQTADEVIQISEATEKINNTVLVDLLISLLGQTAKFHRAVAYCVYAHMLPTISKDDVSHIIETLMLSDKELSGKNEESDGEDEDEMEEDLPSDSEDISDGSDTDTEDAKVDPNLVNRLQDALSNGQDNNDSEASLSDMDDEAMFAMDEKLAAAFKSMVPSTKKKEATTNMQTFRSKVVDLLLFTVSSAETPEKIKLDLIVPLLRLVKVQLKRSNEGPSAVKSIELLGIIAKLKKITCSEKQVIKLLNKLVEASSDISNPGLVKSIGAVAAFLFGCSLKDSKVLDNVKEAYTEVFTNFVTQEDGSINNELATATIYRYPSFFESELVKLSELAFNESYRIFRRTETLLCINAIVKISTNLEKSGVKTLLKKCKSYINTAIANSSDIKPRFFASVLKVIHTVSTCSDDSVKEVVTKTILTTLEPLIENETLWKTDLKKCNSACQQLCGKAPVHVVKAIVKVL